MEFRAGMMSLEGTRVVQLTVGTNFDVQGGPYNNTDLAHITRQIFSTVLVCYKWTFLARNCDFVVDMYFPEAE
jgi:hypothetical protein